MKQHLSILIFNLVLLIITFLTTSVAMAETSGSNTSRFSNPVPANVSAPESKLVSSFTSLAGSSQNAISLVRGLRSGTSVVLINSEGATPESVSFVVPTRPMGYGNIRIALSLAKTQLASQGITQPTSQQLQSALVGTSATEASSGTGQQGILQMRASGMGWGKIANSMGVKLGSVMSGKSAIMTNSTTAAVNPNEGRPAASSSQVTTAGGIQGKYHGTISAEGTKSTGISKGIVTGQGHGRAAGVSGGAVNAAGSQSGSISSAGVGRGAGHGAGGKKP